LGSKNYFILLQVLVEAIILCLLGGLIGLGVVFLGTLLIGAVTEFDIALTEGNIVLGLTVSAIIGVISGFMPAYSASQMDPVEAIRSN
jgi:putative ABC transport system permease protein